MVWVRTALNPDKIRRKLSVCGFYPENPAAAAAAVAKRPRDGIARGLRWSGAQAAEASRELWRRFPVSLGGRGLTLASRNGSRR
uniref:Uncharacterized protein n=1 Tax=Setaria viridis TaxID=4556 RepID=A0A4V6D386_SETVI|nr:hypothetical protein SEVIR_8G184332v2 [Setaria viridis]